MLTAGHFLQTHPHHVVLLVSGGEGQVSFLTAHASSQVLVPGLPCEWLQADIARYHSHFSLAIHD